MKLVMKRQITLLITAFALLLSFAPEVQADASAAIKSRMAQRLSKVVALKQNGSLGENNLGYLSARKALSAADNKLMAAENADRKAVYKIIATKADSTAGAVGKARAASIRKSAPKGTWVQLTNGSWKKM